MTTRANSTCTMAMASSDPSVSVMARIMVSPLPIGGWPCETKARGWTPDSGRRGGFDSRRLAWAVVLVGLTKGYTVGLGGVPAAGSHGHVRSANKDRLEQTLRIIGGGYGGERVPAGYPPASL